MAVFYDDGGGDIYAGETKEACLEAMLKDCGDEAQEWIDEGWVSEVPGSKKMRVEKDDGTSYQSTLEEEYTNLGYGYCIASVNC